VDGRDAEGGAELDNVPRAACPGADVEELAELGRHVQEVPGEIPIDTPVVLSLPGHQPCHLLSVDLQRLGPFGVQRAVGHLSFREQSGQHVSNLG